MENGSIPIAADNRDPRGTWEITASGKTIPLTISGELEKPEAKIGEEKVAIWMKDDADPARRAREAFR